MKKIQIAVLALAASAAAVPLLAAPRLCGNGRPAALSGDLFSPAECSSTTLKTAALPGEAPLTGKNARTGLKDLDGRWEGNLNYALGRYELLLTVKTGWGGKADLTLELKELQFHQRLTDRLTLVPAKENGRFEAVMTTSLLPDAALNGGAIIGESTGTARTPGMRQTDLLFTNGAAHRAVFTLRGKDELQLRVLSAIPGAPLQDYEISLTRTKREAL